MTLLARFKLQRAESINDGNQGSADQFCLFPIFPDSTEPDHNDTHFNKEKTHRVDTVGYGSSNAQLACASGQLEGVGHTQVETSGFVAGLRLGLSQSCVQACALAQAINITHGKLVCVHG